MAFSVSPSVIINEIDTTASIERTSTAPAAIAGVFNWGPTFERTLITSETELVARFGKPSTENFETFFTAANYLAYSSALYVTRVVDDVAVAATASGSPFKAKYPGTLGNSLFVTYTSQDKYYDSLLAIGAAYGTGANNPKTILVECTDSTLNTKLLSGDILRFGNASAGYQRSKVNSVAALGQNPTTLRYRYNITLADKYSLKQLDFNKINFQRYWGYSDVCKAQPIGSSYIHLLVIDRDGLISGAKGTILEKYENISIVDGVRSTEGASLYYKDVLDAKSQYITYTATVPTITDVKYRALSGGLNGGSEDTIDTSYVLTGYDEYANVDEVDVSFILQGRAKGGDGRSELANYLRDNIVETRKDCMLFISPPRTAVVTPVTDEDKLDAIIAFRNMVDSSSYWFMDSGYKYQYDRYNDVYRWVPLNGDIAGLASKTDPWESPAGYTRGIIKNAAKLAYNPNKTHRDTLYGADINPVMVQKGIGIILFGDKTGQGYDSAFDRINVRRLFITVEKAIATAAASFLFEFNDTFTQLKFKNMINPYLANIQSKRGIIDYKVLADSTINTPDTIDSNILKAQIYIKPAKSINTIELTFVATRTGTSFEEIIGEING